MQIGIFTFSTTSEPLYCAKCGKVATRVIKNPNRWKKYSRNRDHLMTECCHARIIGK